MLPVVRFEAFIKQQHLFNAADPILLAVSGGRDSVLMTSLFDACGFKFGIAHCNFMLRGMEADADETFTRQLAERFQVPFYSTRFDTGAYAREHRVSVQMAARSLRYTWLEQIRSQHQYQYIATAHHQNDAIETTILNLVRGTGIAGLHGILPKRDRLIRPLLFLSREEVDKLVSENKIAYRDDASNFSSKYARNKIRLEVIPKLKELNPSLEETFEANAKRFADLEILLSEKLAELRTNLLIEKEELTLLPIQKVLELKPIHTLLFELLKPFAFTEPVVADLIRSLKKQPGLKFVSDSHCLIIDREHLIIGRKDEKTPTASRINPSDTIVFWHNGQVSISQEIGSNFPVLPSSRQAMVDAGKLEFPLWIRTWKEGDYFYPLGLNGKKKLSDFFINQKVPLPEKARIPLLVNGNGDIIWVMGMRLDDRYKVSANTKKLYIFEWK